MHLCHSPRPPLAALVFCSALALSTAHAFGSPSHDRARAAEQDGLGAAASAPEQQPTATVTQLGYPYPVVCDFVLNRVSAALIGSILSNPSDTRGYGEPCYPYQPAGPFNPRKRCLSLVHPSQPYNPVSNRLTWKCGCP